VIVKAKALIHLERRHMASDAAAVSRNAANHMLGVLIVVALDAGVNVLVFRHRLYSLVGVVTGCASHLPIGFQIATASKHPDGLKTSQKIRILSNFAFGKILGQPMAIPTKLNF
tara:strand:- start:139 stop:480 length:342 start_codon:yes stop_codon:yes gene_type:complete